MPAPALWESRRDVRPRGFPGRPPSAAGPPPAGAVSADSSCPSVSLLPRTSRAQLRLALDHVFEVKGGALHEGVEEGRAKEEVEGERIAAVVEVGQRFGALPETAHQSRVQP